MPNGPAILIDFVIITPFMRLVPKEMNRLVVYPRNLLLMLEMLQTVRLIPTGGEDVERYLTTNGERKTEVGELFFKSRNELFADLVLFVEFVEILAFLNGCIPAYGRDVDHAIPEVLGQYSTMPEPGIKGSVGGFSPEFDESPSLDWTINLANVPQTEVDQLLVLVLSQPSDETSTR